MAQVEHTIKDYGRKIGWIRSKEYRVTPSPILWHRENNKLILQAFMVLQSGLVAVPLIAGMDKFVNILADWPQFLTPFIPQYLGFDAGTFMLAVGILEVVMALGIALWPRIFSVIFMGWMGLIILNLLTTGEHLDIVLRDFGLMAAAFSLWRLSLIKEEVPLVTTKTEADLETPDLSSTELAH